MEERRRFVRVKGLEEVKYTIKNSGQNPRSIKVKDMSLIGINLYADTGLEKGTVLELELKLPNDPNIINLDAEVLWQLPYHNNKFATGIRFKYKDEQIKKRLSDYIHDCAKRVDECREFVRCNIRADVVCSYVDKPGEKFKAQTVDISRGGIKLVVGQKVEAGARIKVIFILPDSEEKVEAELKVVWSRPENNEKGFALGAIFTKLESRNKDLIWKFIEDYCQMNLED